MLEHHEFLTPQPWRSHLLNVILRLGLLFSLVVYPVSVHQLIRKENWTVVAIDSVAVVTIAVLYWFDTIPFRLRAGVCCLTCYVIGITLLVNVAATSHVYLVAFFILTTLLLGRGWGLMAVVLGSLTMLLAGLLGYVPNEMGTPRDRVEWAVITLNFGLIVAVLTLGIGTVIARLEGALLREMEWFNEQRRLEQALHQSQKMEAIGQLAGVWPTTSTTS